MEGERILNNLLKKKLDGLYDETKNYIATLTRVLDPDGKNGFQFKANGCNTIEQIVSKYSAFCNKFLRCAIEAIKVAKDSKDLKSILKIVDMIIHVLDMVLSHDNGKYHKVIPSLDDLGTKLYHISSQLIAKNAFDLSIEYVEHFIKYVQLAKNQEEGRIKEIQKVAKSMGTLCWRAAALIEQSSKGCPCISLPCSALKWRLHGISLDAEASSEAIPTLITKTTSSVVKFLMTCGSDLNDVNVSLLSDLNLSFGLLIGQFRQQYTRKLTDFKCVFSLFDLGLLLSRLFHSWGKPKHALSMLEKLQGFTNEMLKSVKSNTSESHLISKISFCNIMLTKASILMDDMLQKINVKSSGFEKLDKLLSDGHKALELLFSRKDAHLHPTTSQTLDHLRNTLQHAICKVNKELPQRTFSSLLLLFDIYSCMLRTEVESQTTDSKHTKSISKYLSLCTLVMTMYRQQIQVQLEKMSEESNEVMSRCLQYSKQCSDTIKILVTNGCSSDELIWHSQFTCTIGMDAYKHDKYDMATEFMMLACCDMKDWCCLGDHNMIGARIQQLQLLIKYEAIRDCQRRSKCFQGAYDTSSTIIELLLYLSQEDGVQSLDLQKYIQMWVQSKHEVIKNASCDDMSDFHQRTLLHVIEDKNHSVSDVVICHLLQEELSCCKILNTRYDTLAEQLSVTSQMITIYRGENSLSLSSALLEHVRILHALGTIDQTPLKVCQEAMSFLEARIKKRQGKDSLGSLISMKDSLAKVFFWKGIFEHEAVLTQHEKYSENKERDKTNQLNDEVISLDQPFILSLHGAVDNWTSMVEDCLNKSKHGKLDLSELSNPQETVDCLKMVGLLYGLLRQPLNQVHANHLCALICQATDRADGRDTAIELYTESIHTLCSVHDLHHAQMIMSHCKKIQEETSLQLLTETQVLLARSHLHLELGEVAEGEKCLKVSLESVNMLGKSSSRQVVLQSMVYSLIAKFLQLPPTIHKSQLLQDSGGCEMTSLDAAIESITKLESIVKTLCTLKKDRPNTGDGPFNTKLMAISNTLLDCQLQCGYLMSHQGMIKKAIKYCTDGLVLSRKMALPYRVLEFVGFLSEVLIHKGDHATAEKHILQVCHVLGPVLQTSRSVTALEDCLQAPALINHSDACRHVCCIDPTLQALQISFFITLCKYLEYLERHQQAIAGLEIADQLISHATKRLNCTLQEFSSVLQLGSVFITKQDGKISKTSLRKKGSRGKQPSKLDTDDFDMLSTIHIMYSSYLCQVFVQNALILLDNLKVKKVLDVVKGGIDVVKTVEVATGSTPFWLIPTFSHLLYLQGVACVLQTLHDNNNLLDAVWGWQIGNSDSKKGFKTENSLQYTRGKRKGRTARARDQFPINDNAADSPEKAIKRNGRGRSKKSDKQTQECSKERSGNEGFQLARNSFDKALDLCSCWPNHKLFSKLCQCLALCIGPCDPAKTAHCLDMSLGITLRHEAAYTTRTKIRKLLKNHKPEEPCGDVSLLTSKLSSLAIDDSVINYQYVLQSLQQTRKLMLFTGEREPEMMTLPKDWTICTLVSIQLPGQPCQLVISRQQPGTKPILVKVSMPDTIQQDDTFSKAEDSEVNKAVLDLSQLLQGSIHQEFSDIMQSSLESMTISDDKDWQHARSKLDSRLKVLLERMENSWLGMWKGIVLGKHDNDKRQEALKQTTKDLKTKLTRYTSNIIDEDMLQMIVDSYDYLTPSQSRDGLSAVTGIDNGRAKLDQAVEDLQQAVGSLATQHSGKKKNQTTSDRHPVILILGKNIQHLPWENIPILRKYPVTRMPSMQFVLAQTQKGEQRLDPAKTYFVLNPDNNLPNTQKIFQNWFESELQWQGISGEKPSQDQFKGALSDHDLFLYLGHNAGQSFLGGDDVQRVNCRATVLLMGCSSAKLTVDGICEPRGMSLRYLLAGCPAIVGNLWDVTDRDIDRFTKFLLKAWLQSGQKWPLPQFLRNARQACKWPFLIGASPVVYGVPVFLKND